MSKFKDFTPLSSARALCFALGMAMAMLPNAGLAQGNGGDAMRVITLPRIRAQRPVDLCVATSPVAKPNGVLLLCLNDKQNVAAVLNEPAWRDFAQANQLCLAALTTSGRDAKVTEKPWPKDAKDMSVLVRQALDDEFGGNTPLLLYAWPDRADLAASFLAANPARVRSWCLHAPIGFAALGKTAPPGIIVSQEDDPVKHDALLQDFTRARLKEEPLTWLVLPGKPPAGRERVAALETFARSYFAAVLTPKRNQAQWQNIKTKAPMNLVDFNAQPSTASYLPDATLGPAWAALHAGSTAVVMDQPIVEREMDTFVPEKPRLHFYLRLPPNTGEPNFKVAGILAYCTHEKDRAVLLARMQNRQDFLVRFAEEHHLALITWDTAQVYSTTQSADEQSRLENQEFDRTFDRLADAWDRGIHALCYENKLPETDLLLYGISRGAQWAHRLALRKPQRMLAVAIHINSSYDAPVPEAKNILWLQTTGELEYGYPAALRFYAKCRELGYPIIFKAGENLGHRGSPQIEQLETRFFDYALSVKAERDRLTAATANTLNRSAKPDLYAIAGFARSPYFADFINQEVYGAPEQEMVPAGQRVPLPTKELAQAWGKNADAPEPQPVSNPKRATGPAPARPAPSAAASPSAENPVNYFGSTEPNQ